MSSTQGHAPDANEALPGCLRAQLPQPLVGAEGANDRLPQEVILVPRAASSYGWVTGQLLHPLDGSCLASSPHSVVDVVFRSCDPRDLTQQWQWKAPLPDATIPMSVLQHQATGQVLERLHAVEQVDVFGLADYRVGADSQRFLLLSCNR